MIFFIEFYDFLGVRVGVAHITILFGSLSQTNIFIKEQIFDYVIVKLLHVFGGDITAFMLDYFFVYGEKCSMGSTYMVP